MAYGTALTLDDALAALAATPATIVAGATDVFPAHGEGRLTGPVIDISRIEALRGIETDAAGTVRIGAGATWTDLINAPLPPAFDGLKAAAREVGAVQIQNRATLAGNLCTASPAGDGIPCLLALDARVALAHAGGQRTLPLAAFITGVRRTALLPGELVTAIVVPPPPAGATSAFLKLGARHSLVISIAMASAVVAMSDAGAITAARIAVGACSPVAVRLTALERDLVGHPIAHAARLVAPRHTEPLAPISDVRGSADYRREAAAELVRRTLDGCAPRREQVAA